MEDEVIFDAEEKYFEDCNVDERPKKLKEKILEWCKKGDTYHLKKYINDKSLNIEEPDSNNWTAIQWGIVNNQVEVVKILLEKIHTKKDLENNVNEDIEEEEIENDKKENQRTDSNLNVNNNHNKNNKELVIPDRVKSVFGIKKDDSSTQASSEIDFDEIFKKPTSIKDKKYTPLHWAAYKGNILLSSILLKYKYSPLEVDMYGNTALHQAAASNNKACFKIFMGLGIDLDIKNARSHTPLELASNEEIKALIKKTSEKSRCGICNSYFSFFVKKYICNVKEEIICKDCCKSNYYYENENSLTEEILECRCNNCIEEISKEEKQLIDTINKQDLNALTEHYNHLTPLEIRINPKLKIKAIQEIDKLQRVKKINQQIKELENVTDHKTIEKSVFMMLKELEDAKNSNIKFDIALIEKVIQQKDRKIAEKELRKLLSNVNVYNSSVELKNELDEKLKKAIATGVNDEFVKAGNELLEKVCLNLDCLSVYNDLFTYPPREYIPKDPNDKKKKKPEPPKKKKKKKEAPFPTPVWAVTAKDVKDKVDEYVKYLKMGEQIGLNQEFIDKSKDILARFKLEIEFRKDEELQAKLLEEERLKKMKKKK